MTHIDAMKQGLEALEVEDMACRYEKEATPEHIANAITSLRQAIEQAEKQEPVALEWDEVYDAAAAAYCRSEASRKALRLCFQTHQQTTQISIGWTANELMAFAKTIAYVCNTPQPQREWVGLTDDEQIALLKDSNGKTRHWLVWQVEDKLKQKNGYAEENT